MAKRREGTGRARGPKRRRARRTERGGAPTATLERACALCEEAVESPIRCRECAQVHHVPCWSEGACCAACGCDEPAEELTFACSECEAPNSVSVDLAGGKVHCGACHARIRVPLPKRPSSGQKKKAKTRSSEVDPLLTPLISDVRAVALVFLAGAGFNLFVAALTLGRRSTRGLGFVVLVCGLVGLALAGGLWVFNRAAHRVALACALIGSVSTLLILPFAAPAFAKMSTLAGFGVIAGLLYSGGVVFLMLRAAPLFRFGASHLERASTTSPLGSVYLWLGLASLAPSVLALFAS